MITFDWLSSKYFAPLSWCTFPLLWRTLNTSGKISPTSGKKSFLILRRMRASRSFWRMSHLARRSKFETRRQRDFNAHYHFSRGELPDFGRVASLARLSLHRCHCPFKITQALYGVVLEFDDVVRVRFYPKKKKKKKKKALGKERKEEEKQKKSWTFTACLTFHQVDMSTSNW